MRATTVRNRRRPRTAAPTAPRPAYSSPPAGRHSGQARLAESAVVTATVGVVAVTAVLTGGSGPGNHRSLSVEVKADLSHAIVALIALGYRSVIPQPSPSRDCAASATGNVRQFLTRHSCKEYASTTLTAYKQEGGAQVAISWVVMPTTALAEQYKTEADTPGQGNPPEQSPNYNGLCYASGQDGATVWTEQLQPTGHLTVSADRKILQAAAPVKHLTTAYMQQHCVG